MSEFRCKVTNNIGLYAIAERPKRRPRLVAPGGAPFSCVGVFIGSSVRTDCTKLCRPFSQGPLGQRGGGVRGAKGSHLEGENFTPSAGSCSAILSSTILSARLTLYRARSETVATSLVHCETGLHMFVQSFFTPFGLKTPVKEMLNESWQRSVTARVAGSLGNTCASGCSSKCCARSDRTGYLHPGSGVQVMLASKRSFVTW